MYKNFFFDFDGMLFNTYDHITNAFITGYYDVNKVKLDYKEAYDYLKISFTDAFKHFKCTELEQIAIKKYERDLYFKPLAFPYPAIFNILKSIKDAGCDIYLYTNRDASAISYLKMYDLDKYFTDYIYQDGSLLVKPDPTSLNKMVEKHHLDKKECVIVGDRALDVNGAYNASIDGILYDVDSRVINHRATYVVKRLSELYQFIDIPHQAYDYHINTNLSSNTIGTVEEYINKSISIGIDEIGIVENYSIIKNRIDDFMTNNFVLKEKYHQDIVIKMGIEFNIDSLKEASVIKDEVDYLLFKNTSYMTLNDYKNNIAKAIDSNLFKIYTKLDLVIDEITSFNDKEIKCIEEIGKALKGKDIYIELSYSNIFIKNIKKIDKIKKFYSILSQYKLKYIVSNDAHQLNELTRESLSKLLEFAKELDLKIMNKITL